PADKIIRIHRTSGYSGRPVLIALTANDIKDTHEAGARMFWCAGVRPDDIVVHCLNYCLWIGGITDHLSLEAVGATVIPYGVGNTKKLLELMIQLSPTAISCTPSYLRRLEQVLAEEFRMKPNELGIKKGVFGGEAGIQDPVIRNSIEKKWDMRAIDANYGVSDVLSAFGSECDVRNGLHYHAQGIVLPELIDPVTGEKLEIKAGQTGEMVYTNLKREAQPLIRFRTRDTVEIVHVGKCPCGRSGFRFKVLGRSDDMLVVKGINVFPAAIQTVLLRYPEELNGEFEIVLSGKPPYESLSVKVEIRKDMKPCDARRLKCKIENDIKEELTVKTVIELVRENSIPREGDKVKRIRRI
ncbi:MAG TPA: phenylacetate--CoA ligase family protein, partial [Candidatus Omnitrophota bacterium]|nr:phenylacetate--CoA ligase family protein [Candidatus Omnitrophota bacterium]